VASFLLLATLTVLYGIADKKEKALLNSDQQVTVTIPLAIDDTSDNAAQQNDEAENPQWQHHTISHKETLSDVFKNEQLSLTSFYKILREVKETQHLHQLKNGQTVSFVTNKQGFVQKLALEQAHSTLLIELTDNGYVSKTVPLKSESIDAHATVLIKTNITSDARQKGLPYKYVLSLEKLFESDINFSRDIRAGDHFTIVYKRYLKDGAPNKYGPIMAASFTNRGKTYYAFRFKQANDPASYFDAAGKNLKPSFDRYPLHPIKISSRFSTKRMHPVLGYRRPHKGVDLVAKANTPIHAVSDGIISKIGKNAGYGNMVKIQHNKNISTLYAHMTRTAKGLKRYSKVKRGQVIGYVGQTGLASGPHCHFEFHKNGVAINPQTAKLPFYQGVNSRYVYAFQKQKEDYMGQLKLLAETDKATA
jgi:murein DD-endopeptidase MepM/ murein hydrolase activator NlpD